ncbi:MAG: mitofilin family membrane protein, partial [Pseudomonadota bacterium]
ALKSDITARLGKVARPADIETAIAPVAEQVAGLQESVQGVVQAEADRKVNAQRIVLSLELANLERAIERGDSFEQELAAVRKSSDGVLDLAPLSKFETSGVATVAQLKSSFEPIIANVLAAEARPAEGSILDQLLAGAKSVVRVRSVDHDPSDMSAEAVVARIEKALDQGQLDRVLDQAKSLQGDAAGAAAGWLERVQSRHAVDVALASIDEQLKTSLSGTAG